MKYVTAAVAIFVGILLEIIDPAQVADFVNQLLAHFGI